MNQEQFSVAPSANNHNVFFIYRESGSEIKVSLSDTNERVSNYYTMGNKYLVSPVCLTDDEIQYFQKHS